MYYASAPIHSRACAAVRIYLKGRAYRNGNITAAHPAALRLRIPCHLIERASAQLAPLCRLLQLFLHVQLVIHRMQQIRTQLRILPVAVVPACRPHHHKGPHLRKPRKPCLDYRRNVVEHLPLLPVILLLLPVYLPRGPYRITILISLFKANIQPPLQLLFRSFRAPPFQLPQHKLRKLFLPYALGALFYALSELHQSLSFRFRGTPDKYIFTASASAVFPHPPSREQTGATSAPACA